MAKLEIPIVVDIDAVEELLEELKRLQTYKLGAGDDLILVDRDDVVEIITMHIEAKQRKESKTGRWINHVDRGMCECNICGEMIETERAHRAHYCPNCGAYMGGEQDGKG